MLLKKGQIVKYLISKFSTNIEKGKIIELLPNKQLKIELIDNIIPFQMIIEYKDLINE